MNQHDQEYFLIRRDKRQSQYSVNPTKETAKRRFKFKALLDEDGAAVFETQTKDLSFIDKDFAFLFCSPNFLVSGKLKDEINKGLYQAKFFPAIVRAENGDERQDFWLLNTFGKLDCWDRENSIVDDPDDFEYETDGIEIFPSVVKFSLDENVLAKINEEDRLIFKMGKTDTQPVFVHQKVVDVFLKHSVKGVAFYQVSQYEFGVTD